MIEALEPELQARAIYVAAQHAEPFIEGSRRFIASVWDVLRQTHSTRLELPGFKTLLLALQRKGLVSLTRLDLVRAAEQRGQRALMDRSETLRPGYGGLATEYHLIAI